MDSAISCPPPSPVPSLPSHASMHNSSSSKRGAQAPPDQIINLRGGLLLRPSRTLVIIQAVQAYACRSAGMHAAVMCGEQGTHRNTHGT